MTVDDFNAFCAKLPATTHVVQWGGADVWKVGGKVFAICGWNDDRPGIVFKASAIAFEMLRDLPGVRPAPYLASRGMRWLQNYALPGLDDGDLKDHLVASHEIVVAELTRKVRRELGLSE